MTDSHYMGGSFPSPLKDKLKELIVETLESIEVDNERGFAYLMRAIRSYERKEGKAYTKEFIKEVLKNICLHRAVKCATCLLEKDCRVTVDDLNVVVDQEEGLTPLHLAARNLCYDLTKLFLLYGAHPNLSCDSDHHKGMLPLGFALEGLSNHQLMTNWNLDKSLYTLIFLLHLKEMAEPFNTISLLAARTTRENLEKMSLGYAKEGEVIKLTALLLVAWDELVTPYADIKLGGVKCCPIVQCIRNEIHSVLNEQEMNDQCSHKRELLKLRKTKLKASWKMLLLLLPKYDSLNEYRHGLSGPCFKKNPEKTFNHKVPRDVATMMGASIRSCMEDVFADDLECFMPVLPPKEKGLLDEVLQNQMRSGITRVYVPPSPHAQAHNGFMASLCGARPFHTSSKFNLRKELRGQLIAAKVKKPSFWQLPTFRMCTHLVSIAKRGLK